jgi:hypothetical protein
MRIKELHIDHLVVDELVLPTQAGDLPH